MGRKQIDVTAQTVKGWVEGTIEEWLPGYTDFDEKNNMQFKITHVGEGLYLVAEGSQVSARLEPRAFRVVVHVVEQP